MLARYMMLSSVCLSVRPSFLHKPALYQNSKMPEHANNAILYPRDSGFLTPKISTKSWWGTPNGGTK